MKIDLFDARMLEPLVSYLEENGARSETFLDRARIPGEVVADGGWITKKQAYDFTFEVVERSRCPDAVFAACHRFELPHLGPIEAAMKSAKTVKESLEIGARLGSTAYEGNEYFLWSDGAITWFCYREPLAISEGQTFINDMTITVYYRMICALVEETWRPEQLLIRGEAINRHRGSEIFADSQARVHPHYTALGFPTEFLSRRLAWQQPPFDFDEGDGWLFGPEGSEPIVDALYRLLASLFTYRTLPTLEETAMIVDVSPATLKRQLAAAGTNYRRLLDRLRFDAACDMLSIPKITVREIAHELGYSGTNNFVRAFRRLTGLTPGEYQRMGHDHDRPEIPF